MFLELWAEALLPGIPTVQSTDCLHVIHYIVSFSNVAISRSAYEMNTADRELVRRGSISGNERGRLGDCSHCWLGLSHC